jgi:phosphate-selective porin
MLGRFSLEILRCTLALCLALSATQLAARQRDGLTVTSVNEAQWQNQKRPSTALLIKLQI